MFVFLAGVDHELCDHTPPRFFIIVSESRGVLATHALYLSLVSLSPRSLTPDPLQRILVLWHFPSLRARRARSSRGLPVGPGPSRVPVRTQCRDADCVLCTNRQYVDMIAHSPPSRIPFRLVRFSYHRPFGCIARPAVAVAGEERRWCADW